MSFADIVPSLKAKMPALCGRLLPNELLAPLTWFRVGGPAQVLFMPEDEADLAYLLKHLSSDIPVTVVGLGSNLIVRDGGVPGVVIVGRPWFHGSKAHAFGPAPQCRMCGSRAARSGSRGLRSCVAFRVRSVAHCA